jgi:hypothetical protein
MANGSMVRWRTGRSCDLAGMSAACCADAMAVAFQIRSPTQRRRHAMPGTGIGLAAGGVDAT